MPRQTESAIHVASKWEIFGKVATVAHDRVKKLEAPVILLRTQVGI